MNGQGNGGFFDDSSDDDMHMIPEHQGFGMGINRHAGGGPVRLVAHRRQLPAVPAPGPIQVAPIAIGEFKTLV